jgi:hypothetical protein
LKNQIINSNSLRNLAIAALAVCVTATSLSASAYGEPVQGGIHEGGYGGRGNGGFDNGRGSGRDDFDGQRRGPRRGDLRDPREVARLVDLLYRGALNRYADQAGIDGFGREILNRGYQGLYDSARFIGSVPEFSDNVRNVGSRRIVINIYRVFFNRRPDPSGMYNWTRLIDEGRGGDALEGIVKSQEFYEAQLY